MLYRFHSKSTKHSSIRVTVVATVKDGNLKVAVARCGKKDMFSKKKGRLIAENRLNADKLYNEYPMATCDGKTFVKIANKVAEEVRETKIIYNVRENVLKFLKNDGITEEETDDIEVSKGEDKVIAD